MNDDIQVLDTGQDTDTSTYVPYEMINFENGTLVTPASANLETGAVTMPVYSGRTPVNDTNLNHLEQGLKDLETHVLDLPDVENSLASDSTTNAPSINAVNTALNKLGTRMLIFEGTGNMNTAITINTTWEALGKFKNLTVELNYVTNNNHTTVTFPFELLSDGTNLANSARVTNVYMPIVNIVNNTFGKIHLVPYDYVTTNSIKFDDFDASITIARMWVEY